MYGTILCFNRFIEFYLFILLLLTIPFVSGIYYSYPFYTESDKICKIYFNKALNFLSFVVKYIYPFSSEAIP